jgi:DNA-binding NarL/FixJ family response regulator
VGEAENGQQALEQVRHLLPDVVLMDITMPVLNGLEATRQINTLFPSVRVLVLTVHSTKEHILQILRAGACGYLVKQAAVTELVQAIQTVYQGKTFLSPSISREAVEDYVRQAEATEDSYHKLTERERDVLKLIAEGHTNREIASVLHVTVKTVEAHRAHLMDKLDLHCTADLTKYALRKDLISSD